MPAGAPVSRRAVLTGAVVLVGAGALGAAGVATGVVPGSAGIRRRLGLDGPDGEVPDVVAGTVTTRSVESAARGARVSLATMSPAGVGAAGLPVLLALHGRGANAQTLVDLGLPEFLTAAVQAGAAPFAIAAVDGGDRYWHRVGSDDPQAMLRDEVPGWLGDAGFGTVFGALGISMGAFGALLWARLAAKPPAAVIALSPALFRSWGDAKVRDVFVDQADWTASEPLRHLDAIDGSTLGVWCGTEDPFVAAARELAAGTGAAAAHFDPGAHTEGYWRRVLPDALAFAAAAVPRA
ncbi:MAG TPA: alpha/beta hydrolase-fold protein [Cellulomonas sp.]|uniref:alpha/beta hydrolase-fold protein n=1 Tax=Cellulomonas sp. TaxID=40001 RepID=UPI002E35340C|nr:alpha/beta hydrolase-fold protein [Cellulomonas sp.]HEX5331759.1 alpha/beta hydrolase-fold protein [Cellulomonas sp.]